MRRNLHWTRHFLPLLTGIHLAASIAVPARAGPVASIPSAEDPARFILDEAGRLQRWDPEAAALEPVEDFPHTVNDLAIVPESSLMLALPTAPREEGQRRKRDGRLLILRPTVTGVAVIREIVIEGEGIRAVPSDDGGTAYILAFRPGRRVSSGVGVRVHAVDLASGKTTGSAALAGPPFGVALASDGGRLFLSRPDRIDTLTTNPIVASWHYRSPGPNLGLEINRHDGALYVIRDREIAQFDPRIIAQRTVEERRAIRDDASLRIPLSIRPHELIFSTDGRIGAALGRDGAMSFFDPEWGKEIGSHDLSRRGTAIEAVRTVRFVRTAPLLIAAFPGPSLIRLPVPAPAAPIVRSDRPGEDVPLTVAPPGAPLSPMPPTGQTPAPAPPEEAASPAAADDRRPGMAGAEDEESGASSTPGAAASGIPAPEPTARPGKITAAGPSPDEAASPLPSPGGDIRAAPGLTLAGTIAGEAGLVGTIVIYGPGSIIREAARVRPGPDGRWKATLAAPGRYRVVPIAGDGRPLSIRPHFRTVDVTGSQGIDGIDFEIRLPR